MFLKYIYNRLSYILLSFYLSANAYAGSYDWAISSALRAQAQEEHDNKITLIIIAAFALGIAILWAILRNKNKD
jgi:hypothetical protein